MLAIACTAEGNEAKTKQTWIDNCKRRWYHGINENVILTWLKLGHNDGIGVMEETI